MIYFLFLNHPKGEKIYKVNKTREKMLKSHFKSIDTLKTQVVIEGRVYDAIVDYTAFSNLANFDCFNCQDPCCADNPTIYNENTRDLILENLKEYNDLTKNIEILSEMGYSFEDIIKSIEKDNLMAPDEHIENEISLCTCSFKPNNSSTLCSIHSICLGKNMTAEDIIKYKPLVCNLWPMDIIAEDDLSVLYITIPDDFTTGFTIEDYYDTPCINRELTKTAKFRRKNPIGFNEEDFKPIIAAYGDTIKYALGNNFYEILKSKLLEEKLVFTEDFGNFVEQIKRNF